MTRFYFQACRHKAIKIWDSPALILFCCHCYMDFFVCLGFWYFLDQRKTQKFGKLQWLLHFVTKGWFW